MDFYSLSITVYRPSIKHLPRCNNSFPNSLRKTSMWPCLEPNPPACGSSSAGHDPVGSLFVDCWWWYHWYWLHWHASTLMICSYLFPGCTKGTCFGYGTSPVVLEDSNQEVLVELGWCWSTRTPLDWYHSNFCDPSKPHFKNFSISVDKNQRMPIVDHYFEAHPMFTSFGYGMQIWPFRSTRRQFTTHSTAMKDLRL